MGVLHTKQGRFIRSYLPPPHPLGQVIHDNPYSPDFTRRLKVPATQTTASGKKKTEKKQPPVTNQVLPHHPVGSGMPSSKILKYFGQISEFFAGGLV